MLAGLYIGLMVLLGETVAHAQTLEERVDRLEKAFAVSENAFRAYWKDGLCLETLDKKIELRFGGRLNYDMNWHFPGDAMKDAFGTQDDRLFFRRARLYLRGTLYQHVIFKLEYDFADGLRFCLAVLISIALVVSGCSNDEDGANAATATGVIASGDGLANATVVIMNAPGTTSDSVRPDDSGWATSTSGSRLKSGFVCLIL